ncbi:MAG: drug/metabolite transporter (DMT)-like permease [Kiritimatiellia bacterium]|jgi:drug/metabolite transporter (DMT)-like permease
MGKGEIYALSCAVFWSLAVINFTKAGKNISPLRLNLFKNALALCLLIPTILVVAGPAWPAIGRMDYLLMIVSGLIGISIADAMYFFSLNLIGAGRTGVMNCCYSPFTMLFAWLFLGEVLTRSHLTGFVLVLGGVLIASWPTGVAAASRRDAWLGWTCGIVTPMLIALGILLVTPSMQRVPVLHMAVVRIGVGLIGQIIYLAAIRQLRPTLRAFRGPNPWGPMILATLLGSYLAMLSWMMGFKYVEKKSIAAVLNQTSTIWIILLAAVFLKERLTLPRVVGAALSVAGLVYISLL